MSYTVDPANGTTFEPVFPNEFYIDTVYVRTTDLNIIIRNVTVDYAVPTGQNVDITISPDETELDISISENFPSIPAFQLLEMRFSFDLVIIDVSITRENLVFYLPMYPSDAPCIPTGQRVLTSDGYVPIETLKTGDSVMTADGRSVEITMFSYHLPFVGKCNAPILIPANTFAKNSPINDIILSPQHLIMIKPNVYDAPKHLINYYDNIKRLHLGESITYYNIATPNYLTDDIVVEGTAVESYGKLFADKYPGNRQYYTYNNELKGYTRITMQDVLAEKNKSKQNICKY